MWCHFVREMQEMSYKSVDTAAFSPVVFLSHLKSPLKISLQRLYMSGDELFIPVV
jgi:hypothetical protein